MELRPGFIFAIFGALFLASALNVAFHFWK